jgi:anti-anti-sigma factor
VADLRADNLRLRVVEVREGERTRIELRGELDTLTVLALAIRLRWLRDRRASVLLDLDHLTFIDAGGIRIVLAAAADARADGWRFTVTRGSSCVRLPVELLGLDLPYDESVPGGA